MTITLDQLDDSNMESALLSSTGIEDGASANEVLNGIAVDGAEGKDSFAYGKPQAMALQKANKLADLIMQEPHRFALHGDPQLASNGLEALKALFDFSLETENLAIPPIAATLHSTFPDDEVVDDSTKAGSKRKRKNAKKNTNVHRLFEQTPLSELSVDGMSAGQVWDQMELRNAKVSTLLDAIIVTEQPEDEDADEEDEDGEDEMEGWGKSDDGVAKDEVISKKDNKRAKLGQSEEDEEEIVNNLDKLSDAELRSIGIDPSQRKDFESAIKEGQFDDSEEEEESDDDAHGYPGASDLSDDDELSGVILTEPLLSEAEQQKRKAEIEAREQRQMRSQRQFAKVMKKMQGGSEEDDSDDEDEEEEEEEEEDDDDDGDYNGSDEEEEEERRKRGILDNLDEEGEGSTISNAKKVKRHADLDDDFFSIDQFNKETDDYGDEGVDLGEEIDLFKSVDEPEDDDENEEGEGSGQVYYKDFFGPPPFKVETSVKGKPSTGKSPAKPSAAAEKAPKRVPSVRFNDEVSVLRIKARKAKETQITPELLQMLQQYPDPDSADFDEEGDEEMDSDEEEGDSEDDGEEDGMEEDEESGEETDEEEDEEDEVDEDIMETELGEQMRPNGVEEDADAFALSDSDAEQETAERVAGDLFADEEEELEDDDTAGMSSHQRRLNALQEEITRLERENVGKKDWTLMGEAGSRARPENSLLEEDVEFESNRKSKPVNTPETTKSIEDLIKNRILENQFDDVQRRATLQPLDFMPSKMLELSDQKSSRSLDQVYEDDFGGVGDAQGQKLDKELQKEHEEIDELYENLESQLDALSNAHFTPKAPKVSIQTISNAPTISMEESLPTTMSNGSQLAPEEVYAAGSHNEALEGASSELTPEEKRRRHRQLRDEKRSKNERIAEHKKIVEINREAFGQNRGGRFAGKSGGGKQNGKKASEEKEEALRKLMGNKGVSVVGKGDSNNAKKARSNQSNGQTANAANYKL